MDQISATLRQWLNPVRGLWPDVYMVGGAVRDYLLSRAPKDIDLMCRDAEGLAKQIARTRDAAVVPFLKKADEPCFRVAHRGNPDSFIDIARMRGETLEDDLKRRDFTINAMAIKVESGGILGDVTDPLNGTGDMKERIIRITGPAAIPSDPLRILRALRFAAKFDFTIEAGTLAAMKSHSRLISETAPERIMNELTEIFRTGKSASFIRLMDDLEVLGIIFPEIIPMKACQQNGYHHLDVWGHSMLALENCESLLNNAGEFFEPVTEQIRENLNTGNRLPLLKLTAMLHDVGKPATRGERDDGRITFHGHDKAGAEIISAIAERMRMSNQDHDFVHTVTAEHLNVLNLFFSGAKPSTRMRWFRKLKEDSIPVIIHGMADIKASRGPLSTEKRIEDHTAWSKAQIIKYYQKIKPQLERKDLVNGNDLIAIGMKPGPEIGKLLRKIRNAQDTGQVKTREEAMAMAEDELESCKRGS